MASHCKTPGRREAYVHELNRFIPVDIWGACGPGGPDLSCPRNEQQWLSEEYCYDWLSAKYKFYLSFENTICNDYGNYYVFKIFMWRPIVEASTISF